MGFDDGGGKKTLSSSTVSCSICLESVTDIGERSWAKLQCGHEFHLDCIGSAFNIKGAMQCPNCRKIEKGQWLFATSCRSFTEFAEDWDHGEDPYDLNYSDIFGIQWCPLPAFSRHPSFEEGDIPSIAYQDLVGQHAVFAEHSAVSSSAHQCPYVAYYGPLHSSSLNSVVSADGLNFSNQWGCPPRPSEFQSSYTFPAVETQYHGWEHQSMPFSATSSRLGASDQPSAPSVHQRSSRVNADLSRSGSFVHPSAVNHSSGSRVGSSATSSMVPPYPGSAARARDRAQALEAYSQPPNTSLPMRTPLSMLHGARRSNHRSLSQVGPLPPLSDQTGGLYIFPSSTSSRSFSEFENPSRFHGWERAQFPSSLSTLHESDSSWGPAPPGPTTVGHNSFHHRYGSEQTPSQSRS